jgi:hypothetical protein
MSGGSNWDRSPLDTDTEVVPFRLKKHGADVLEMLPESTTEEQKEAAVRIVKRRAQSADWDLILSALGLGEYTESEQGVEKP